MGLKDLLQQAVKAGSVAKFNVVILPKDYNGQEPEVEMSYIQLGTFLVSSEHLIESVVISLKEE